MFIQRLLVERVRNLQQVAINELGLLNFFIGDNGSGKTSLLESIAIAGQGRSFRHHKIQTVIQAEQSSLQVFAECLADNGQVHKLGVQRDKNNDYLIRIDGSNAGSLAELSAILPVLILDASAFDLLDGSPSQRCRFIDWGVFHVEHQFYDCWRRFNRILKQRNVLLKSDIKDYSQYEPWDKELCVLAARIEHYRLLFLRDYQPVLEQVLLQLDAELGGHQIFYRNGWHVDKIAFDHLEQALGNVPSPDQLQQQLRDGFARDVKYQRSHIGPQRADMQIRLGSHDVRDIYSRGQKKTLIAAMKLAQAKVVSEKRGKRSVLLLDDLPSELDDKHLQRFIHFVLQESFQCFISAVDDRVCSGQNMQGKSRMFHVERGRISALTGTKQETNNE